MVILLAPRWRLSEDMVNNPLDQADALQDGLATGLDG
jgi:hypothetical protein